MNTFASGELPWYCNKKIKQNVTHIKLPSSILVGPYPNHSLMLFTESLRERIANLREIRSKYKPNFFTIQGNEVSFTLI